MQLFWGPRLPTLHTMRTFVALSILAVALGFFACSNDPNAIRQESQKATEQAKKGVEQARTDLTAAAQGVKQGLQSNSQVDLNTADKSPLMSLPGITDQRAKAIIAGRPYSTAHDAVTKGAISESEYQAIANQVTAK